MGVAIYVRVSTESQAEDGTSLDTQTVACQEKAVEMGYTVSQTYVDDSSGAYLDRTGLNALRKDMELGIIKDAVFCFKPDRLSRSLHYQLLLSEEFKQHDIKLFFAKSDNNRDTPDGNLLYQVQGAIAEYEKEMIRERTVRGKLAKARQGQIMPMRTPPYGYIWKEGALLVNDAEAELVRNIFNWYLAGLTMREIGVKLIESGVPARFGAWNASTIRNIIKNETYIGKYIYNRRQHVRIPNKKTAGGRPAIREKQRPESEHIIIAVPALVDDSIWQKAQIQKVKNSINSKRNTKLEYLARGGYLHCADCGRVLQNTSYTVGHGEKSYRVGVYRCPNLAPRNYETEKCISSSVRAEYVDTFIWEDLTTALLQPENIQFIGRENESTVIDVAKERERLDGDRKKLQKHKEMIVELYLKELYTKEDVERKLEKIKREEQTINKQLQVLLADEQESPKKTMTNDEREAIFSQIRPLLIDQKKLSFDDRQFIFRQLVDQITVNIRPGLVRLQYQGVFGMETEHTYTPGQRRKL
ncbi:MAG TPA: recombinase family protein [Desulfosporosinus sp.]|nr:recombinase family protein [Desulfosporosinus sp.]